MLELEALRRLVSIRLIDVHRKLKEIMRWLGSNQLIDVHRKSKQRNLILESHMFPEHLVRVSHCVRRGQSVAVCTVPEASRITRRTRCENFYSSTSRWPRLRPARSSRIALRLRPSAPR